MPWADALKEKASFVFPGWFYWCLCNSECCEPLRAVSLTPRRTASLRLVEKALFFAGGKKVSSSNCGLDQIFLSNLVVRCLNPNRPLPGVAAMKIKCLSCEPFIVWNCWLSTGQKVVWSQVFQNWRNQLPTSPLTGRALTRGPHPLPLREGRAGDL